MLGLRSLNLFLLALLFLAMSLALAHPISIDRELTNAERFKRGLPPNMPRRLFEASVADSARNARASG
ncbi:hypothetical protein CALCODRAFT_479659 [Calocera cornea HHB12733]|uniref:Uncharacterized protein n=1 Tax=Calocera cornea HHB12733 TaxID=1353952 RepID=A0A165JJ85_9BASI|nr:hypothetical protein CALCODRAFT_479659 [Calocera cornea HHB12733]